MFEQFVYEVASEMSEVESVEYASADRAIVNSYSNSGKSTYPCAFNLGSDGETVEIEFMANGPYLLAWSPRSFANKVQEKLK